MDSVTKRLRPGDSVEVKSADEILETLDADGTLNRLPFMPEMAELCGQRFQVSRRVLKTCSSAGRSAMRTFRNDDIVMLERLRCSGAAHDGCQKGCMIFWREAWLRKVGASDITPLLPPKSNTPLLARLKTASTPTTYFCQASELLKATEILSRSGRLKTCIDDVREGNCSAIQMAHSVTVWLFWRIRRMVLGHYLRGTEKSTPVESLSLRSGELVEIKPPKAIAKTLNRAACNRGLFFSPDMRSLCGSEMLVSNKIEKIIVDGSGEMRSLNNTVYLKDSYCGCACVAFGGCPRGEYAYWREIWLQRPASPQKTAA